MISSNLASFPVLLENITWIRNFSLADGQLVGQSHMSHRVGLENLKTVGHLMSVFVTSVSLSHLSNIFYERVSAKRGFTVRV